MALRVIVKTQYFSSTSRWLEIPIGIVCLAVSLLAGIPGIGLGYELLRGQTAAEPLLVVAFVALASFFLIVGVRLVTGWHRKEGGLFSPQMLRFGGLFFLVAPVFLFFVAADWKAFHLVTLIGAGIACFSLANRRTAKRLGSASK